MLVILSKYATIAGFSTIFCKEMGPSVTFNYIDTQNHNTVLVNKNSSVAI